MTFLMPLNTMGLLLRHSLWLTWALNVGSFALQVGDQIWYQGEIKRAPRSFSFQISYKLGYLSAARLPKAKKRKEGMCTWLQLWGTMIPESQNQVLRAALWVPKARAQNSSKLGTAVGGPISNSPTSQSPPEDRIQCLHEQPTCIWGLAFRHINICAPTTPGKLGIISALLQVRKRTLREIITFLKSLSSLSLEFPVRNFLSSWND